MFLQRSCDFDCACKMSIIAIILLFLCCGFVSSSREDCDVAPKGGEDWIIHVMEHNHGWGEHTHRANIALAVAGWKGNETEMSRIEIQLELEITRFLLRNNTAAVHDNDLALYIHALIAMNKNPRNFHGIDLVADLLHRVEYATGQVHPFLVLVLCNSGAVEFKHLQKIIELTSHRDIETRQQTELKALTLKALACAATSSNTGLAKFRTDIDAAVKDAVKCLIAKQDSTDGSFGNAYTTALAVQALIACGTKERWFEKEALEYLKKESVVQVNMIKTYLIVMALNARKVKFIKNLYKGETPEPGLKVQVKSHYVQYSIIANPNLYYTITLKVPVEWNFFEVMEKCSELSENFNFTYYSNEEKHPVVFSVAGVPNDAEENMFWNLCVRHRDNDLTYKAEIRNHSPIKLHPKSDDHITFVYGRQDCGVAKAFNL